MDDSKHTEEVDLSRSEYNEAQNQEAIRNLHKSAQKEHIDFKKVNLQNAHDYLNLPEEEESQRTMNQENTLSQRIYTLEEDKSHDIINKMRDLDNEDNYDQEKDKVNKRANTEGNIDFIDDEGNPIKVIQKKFPSKIGSISMKPHLPQLKLNVPLILSSNEIFEIFANISKKSQFQVIEMEQSIATAVNKEPFSIKRMFMRCLPFQEFKREQPIESLISAIRLQITMNEVKQCRKITLKGLYGDQSKLQDFVALFKTRIFDIVCNLPENKKKGKQNTIETLTFNNHIQPKKKNSSKIQTTLGNKKTFNNMSDDESDEESKHGAYSETSSIYQIHKILSSDAYTLGKNVAQYIESFHLQYKSLKESAELLPQPTEGIMILVNEIVHTFHSEYNLGKESAKSLIQNCRPSVEKYLFSKLYDKLFAMYAIKNEEEDRLFIERSNAIKRMKPSDIMIYLGINEKFIICEHNIYSSRTSISMMDQSKYQSLQRESLIPFRTETQNHIETQRSDQPTLNQLENTILNHSSTSSSLNFGLFPSKQELPYIEAIKSIEKIQQYTSPREKLQCISESFGYLKTAIVDYWKGKVELSAMDDVLPLTIYVMAMADLSHPASEINLIEDYLRIHDKGFDFERKLLTNLDVSIRYINHEWQLSQQ